MGEERSKLVGQSEDRIGRGPFMRRFSIHSRNRLALYGTGAGPSGAPEQGTKEAQASTGGPAEVNKEKHSMDF